MGKFSPTKQHGDCEEIANPSTAFGRRRRNWIDAHGSVPAGSGCRCVVRQQALHHSEARLPTSSRRAAGQVPQDRRPRPQAQGRSALRCSGRRHGRAEPQPIPLRLVRGCAAGQGLGARAAGRERARHESRGMVERAKFMKFGTTWVQLRERESGFLAPKRHQMKHLDFDLLIVRDQGVGGSNPLSPTNSNQLLRSGSTFGREKGFTQQGLH